MPKKSCGGKNEKKPFIPIQTLIDATSVKGLHCEHSFLEIDTHSGDVNEKVQSFFNNFTS